MHTPAVCGAENAETTKIEAMTCYVLSNAVSLQFFCWSPYNNVIVWRRIPNFRYHGNKGQSRANFNDTIKLPAPKTYYLVQDLRLYLFHNQSCSQFCV